MSDQYAVLGNPIEHSLSPRIHSAFAAQTAQTLSYSAVLVPLEGFAETLQMLQNQGFKGMNITVPFKGEAAIACESLSERATAADAVNTLIRTETGWQGDNTDGAGLLRDLEVNLDIELSGKRVLLIGAGGAAAGVVIPLLTAQPQILHIVNRTAAKAQALATRFQSNGKVTGSGLDARQDEPFDLIINATSASLSGHSINLPEGLVTAATECYDMMYSDSPTAFIEWSRMQGAKRAVDGIGMLIEQAAESFYLWRGIRPQTAPVFELLRPKTQ